MFAHKSFLEAGIPVPGASDYGPGPFEPLMAIQSMVTRKDYNGNVWGPRQKVTVDEALTIATINGAYASHEEHVKGSITAGKLADFVMLEKDPHDVNPDTIKDIKVVRTVVGGKTVYPKGRIVNMRSPRTQDRTRRTRSLAPTWAAPIIRHHVTVARRADRRPSARRSSGE